MIFILGGRGFIGSAFARFCQARGLEHEVIQRENYATYVGRHCDVLLNANGNSRKPLAKEKPLEDFHASVESVRRSLVDFKAKMYVYLSSCEVYPDCSSPDATREDADLDVKRQSTYGFHKFLAEQCVRHVTDSWLILRLGGFVGPGIRKGPIFDIVNGGPLWLDPTSELQFLHTDATASIAMTLVESRIQREVFNLCGRGVIRLEEVIQWVGRPIPVTVGSPLLQYDVNIDKVCRLLEVPETRETVHQFVKSQLCSQQI